MRTTVRRGRVILAAATAATLAACGDDTTAGGTDGGSTGGASTSTSTTADPATNTATTSAASSGSSSTTDPASTTIDPDTSGSDSGSTGDSSSSTGTTGEEDSSSTGNPAVSLTPEEVCPFDVSFYDSAEHAPNPVVPGQTALGGPSSGEGSSSMFYLMEGTAGADQIRDSGINDSVFPCVVAGDGDDYIEWEFGEGGEGTAFATISGGLGADTFAYRGGELAFLNAEAPVQTIVDFEIGEDRIILDATLSAGVDAETATVTFEDNFAGGTPTTTGLIVDNANGDIWYAADNGEVLNSWRIIHLDGDVELEAEDLSITETIPGCALNEGFPNDFRDNGATGEGMVGDNPTSAEGTYVNSNGVALGSTGDDFFDVPGNNGPKCVTGGAGDDILRTSRSSSAESISNNPAVLAGGAGADTFVVSIDAFTGEATVEPPVVFADFEPAVDNMVLDPQRLGVGETGEATVTFIDDFDDVSAVPTPGRSIVIDAADGEVWLANDEASNSLLVLLRGAPAITVADVEVISPSDP